MIEIEECKLINSESRLITDDGYDICSYYYEFDRYIKNRHLTKFPIFDNRSIYAFDIENKSYIKYTSEIINTISMKQLFNNKRIDAILDYVINTYMKNDIDETDRIYNRLRYVKSSSVAQYNIKDPIKCYKKKVVPLDDIEIKRIIRRYKS